MRVLQESEMHQVNGGVAIKAVAGITAGFGAGLGFAGLFFSAAEILTQVTVIAGCSLIGLICGLI